MQQLLKDRRAKIILAVLLAIGLCYLGNAAWKDSLHRAEIKIHAAFGLYRDSMNKRAGLAIKMLDLLKNYAPQEQLIYQQLAKSYDDAMRYQPPEQMLTNAALAAEFTQLQQSLLNNMRQAQKIAQNYPGLIENRYYFLLQNEWREADLQVTGLGERLNRQIAFYNSYLTGFPQDIYNKITYRYVLKIPVVVSKTS